MKHGLRRHRRAAEFAHRDPVVLAAVPTHDDHVFLREAAVAAVTEIVDARDARKIVNLLEVIANLRWVAWFRACAMR